MVQKTCVTVTQQDRAEKKAAAEKERKKAKRARREAARNVQELQLFGWQAIASRLAGLPPLLETRLTKPTLQTRCLKGWSVTTTVPFGHLILNGTLFCTIK